MLKPLIAAYEWLVIARPRLTLAMLLAVTGFFAFFATDFRLDASSDSLLLENDRDLRFYRGIVARYGSDTYLVITYTAHSDLFSAQSIDRIKTLRKELNAIDGVESVLTMLDVPLVNSPRVTLRELQDEVPTLLSKRTDTEMARSELTQSPIYSELIMSRDGNTTALLIKFRLEPEYVRYVAERDVLRERAMGGMLGPVESREIDKLDKEIKDLRAIIVDRQRADIKHIRAIIEPYREHADIRLGGLPIIVADMLDYILNDVIIFGATIIVFLIGMLSTIFVRPRWVILSLSCCLLSVVLMIGYLGMTRWPVTVVSANFVALLLIFSLSLTVHLIVRYRELHVEYPKADQAFLVSATLRDKFQPCLFTSLTTMVGFGSLLVTGIRPVIDFGWMMVAGMVVVLITAFTFFPAGLMLSSPGKPQRRRNLTGAITGYFAQIIARHRVVVVVVYALIAVASIFGVTRLTVENRFLDNFKESSEIYQGLLTIDQELGGTTPLDVIIDAPASFKPGGADEVNADLADDDEFADDEFADDEFADDDFADEDFSDSEFGDADFDLGASSYWYNTFRLKTVNEVHDYLESLPETGKVLSMATTMETLQTINDDEALSTFFLSILYKRLPAEVKESLFDPYMSADGNQVRFAVRLYESDPNLRRDELLNRIRTHLVDDIGFAPEQVKLTGMLVLYNNVLQSLFRSQILTIGFVFLAILLMFIVLFRSLRIAVLALVPNMLVAGGVLGLMGLLRVPLDIMTITIAAITVGIGVDNSIHYLHRFRAEFAHDGDYEKAVQRSHGSIGRAMYYTAIIIGFGFSVLVLSNFIPTIYFGLFTSFAMLFAMISNLTLLPLLLIWFKPLGTPQARGAEA